MKRILIIRFSSIGDIVLTTPVVRCVHQQLNAEVHILCKPAYSSIWQANPYVHKVHLLQDDFNSVLKGLKSVNFDLIIDLHKNIRSLKILMALNKPFFTFNKLNLKKWIITNLKIDLLPEKHIVDRYFEGLASLGVQNDGCGLDYFIPLEEAVQPDQYIQNSPPFIAVSLGAAHATKRMPTTLLHQILKNIDAPIFLLGSKEDKLSGELLIDLGLQGRVVLLAGALSLGQTASIIKQSAVLLTSDTGLMHIGAALDIPLITVWGNTIPEFGMYPYMVGKQARYKIFEVEGLACRPCSKIGFSECPKGHFKCMNLQPADQVEKALRQYLHKD